MDRSRRSVNGFRVGVVLLVVAVLGGWWWRRGRDDSSQSGHTAVDRAGPSAWLAADPEGEAQSSGAIAGVVLSSDGRPVDGAVVTLTRARRSDLAWMEPMPRPLQTATSKNGGQFQFERVDVGSYGVAALAEKMAPALHGPVEVTESKTARVELRLGKEAVLLSGHVYDVGGGVVPNARVRVMEIRQSTTPSSVPRVYQVSSDESGVYKIYLGIGQHSLVAEADGYAPANDYFFLPRDLVRDLRLSPAARLSGRVLERGTRQPVSDAQLWIISSRQRGGRPRDVKSDGDGRFAFNDLEPDTYRVGARKGRLVGKSLPVAVALAQSVSDVEVEIDPGLVFAGQVLNSAGAPVPNAAVNLFKFDPPWERP
ncbi:MAG TPA: carboxypeptidase-like regulatory domain-containing protein, partial [Polyangia bacterium]